MKRWQIVVGAVLLVGVAVAVFGPLIYQWTSSSPDPLLERRLAEADGIVRAADLEGRWTVDSEDSIVGYRVEERIGIGTVDAVGRTSDVTGTFEVTDGVLVSGEFVVEMANVQSDRSQRDDQFRTRIMDVETYPTATFVVTESIELPAETDLADAEPFPVTGDLTVRGATQPVEMGLVASIDDGRLRLTGETTIVFRDWGIPNPSLPTAMIFTADSGVLELDLFFLPAE
ncbi:MAG TPA: YceI family protein [Ilumatobacteraceae bacterium]|nr:YceI family protein [Ilumatobacteraceae bacterium]